MVSHRITLILSLLLYVEYLNDLNMHKDLTKLRKLLEDKDEAKADASLKQFLDNRVKNYGTYIIRLMEIKFYDDESYRVPQIVDEDIIRVCFFDGLKESIKEDLKKNDYDDIVLWINHIVDVRCRQIKKYVNECVAKVLTNVGGKNNWVLACNLMVYSKMGSKYEYGAYSNVIYGIISRNFQDNKYFNCSKDEIYRTIVLQFMYGRSHLVDNPPKKLVDDYYSWIKTSLTHFVNNDRKREKIDVELGVKQGEVLPDNFGNNTSLPPPSDGEDRLLYYIDLVRRTNPFHGDLLYDSLIKGLKTRDLVKIEKYQLKWLSSRKNEERLTEEAFRIKLSKFINNQKKDAMDKLRQYSLPDIREKTKELYLKYGHCLDSETDKEVLRLYAVECVPYEALLFFWRKNGKHGGVDKIKEFISHAILLLSNISRRKEIELAQLRNNRDWEYSGKMDKIAYEDSIGHTEDIPEIDYEENEDEEHEDEPEFSSSDDE